MDQPLGLLIALYVRDVLGITQTAAPAGLPRIDPAAGTPDVVLPEGERWAQAWNGWWTRCLAAGIDEHVDVLSPVFIGDAQLAEQVDRLGKPAIAWSRAHRETTRDAILEQALRQGRLIREHLARRGPIAPIRLQILVLPVPSSARSRACHPGSPRGQTIGAKRPQLHTGTPLRTRAYRGCRNVPLDLGARGSWTVDGLPG